MEFEKLKSEDIKSMYHLMQQAFPAEQMREYQNHQILYDKGCFEAFGKKDKYENVVAVISIWKLEEIRYVEHLVVKEEWRGQGIGEKLMQFAFQKEKSPFLLEVELPENDIAKKRIDFYKRLGMYYNDYEYFQPPWKKEYRMLPLRFMTYPEKIDEKTFQRYKNMLYQKVYFYFGKR